MWLLPRSISSAYALAAASSTSASKPPSATAAVRPAYWPYAKGTPSAKPLSWRGWKTRPWIHLLCGATLPPSQENTFAVWWTSSLQASPASPGLQQAPATASRTPTTSGQALSESWTSFTPGHSSSKTSQASSTAVSASSSAIWPPAGMMRCGKCSRPATLVPPTSEDVYGSLPTPVATDWKDRSRAHGAERLLCHWIMRHEIACGIRPLGIPNPPFSLWLILGRKCPWTSSEPLVTQSSRYKRRLLSSLFSIVSGIQGQKHPGSSSR